MLRWLSVAPFGWPAYLATFVLATTLSVAGATLTFFLIEQPMIRFGHRLARAAAELEMVSRKERSHSRFSQVR